MGSTSNGTTPSSFLKERHHAGHTRLDGGGRRARPLPPEFSGFFLHPASRFCQSFLQHRDAIPQSQLPGKEGTRPDLGFRGRVKGAFHASKVRRQEVGEPPWQQDDVTAGHGVMGLKGRRD